MTTQAMLPPAGMVRSSESSHRHPGLCSLIVFIIGLAFALILPGLGRRTSVPHGRGVYGRLTRSLGSPGQVDRRAWLNDRGLSVVLDYREPGRAPVGGIGLPREIDDKEWEVWADLMGNPDSGNTLSDAELVREVCIGNEAAFETLVRRHLPAVHGVALSIVHDSDAADDIAQDSFLSALGRIRQLRNPGSFKGWLLSIARNRALNHLSYEARRTGSSLDGIPDISQRGRPERRVEVTEVEEALEGALGELTSTQRRVFLLHDIEGMDHGQVAVSLGISRGSSRVHLHMARRILRTRLDRSQLEEA